MPSFVIKAAPDQDRYFMYSTVVDAPTTSVGTRQEMFDYLMLYSYGNPTHEEYRKGCAAMIEERLERADKTGSSCELDWYRWGDTFDWRENAPEGYEPNYDADDEDDIFYRWTHEEMADKLEEQDRD